MAIHIAALAACVLALILYYVRRRRNTKYSIPWARSSIPLIGNAIEWGADPLQFLLKQKDLVGDVFRVNLVLIKITFVIGSRVSRAQYVRRLWILKDAPLQWNHWLMQELSEDDASAYQTLPALSCGVISQAHVQRGLPHHVCKTIRLGKCSIQARSYGANHILRTGSTPPARQQDIAKLSLNLAQPAFEDWASQPEIDFFAETSDLLLRITFATCFGEDFAYTHDGELFAIMKALQEGLMNPCSRIFPLWASPSGRGILRAQASLQRMLMAEVQVRLKDWDACREAKDYLSFLLVSNGEKGFVETDSELAAHFVSLMLPTIPVNKVLTNSFAALSSGLLLHYRTRKHGRYVRLDGTAPAAQSRCLVSFRGRDSGQPAQRGRHLSDKEYATQRRMHQRNGTPLRPPISLRYAPRDLIGPDGTVIPKGFVSASPLAVHQDPDLYPQPGKWNPGRFMPSADGTPSNYAKLLKNSEFHMFGSGRHMCPGEKMARTILRGSLWPAVLDNYRLEVKEGLVPGEGVDGVGVKPDHGKTLGVPYGVRPVVVKLVKRKMPLSAVIVG
jgi:sterol 14-demethylase